MSAELAARRTAAAAALADFRRAADEFTNDITRTVPQPRYADWAYRLAAALDSLLQRLEAEATAPDPAECGPLAELVLEDRVDMVNVMTADERAVLLAHIAGYAPQAFDAAVASRPETFAGELLERIDARDAEEEANAPEGYCKTCGANAGWFIGYEGLQHFRGPHRLVTGTERRELFTPDDGHEPAVAWRYPEEMPGAIEDAMDGDR